MLALPSELTVVVQLLERFTGDQKVTLNKN